MKIAVISETAALETRVAATPETIKKLIGIGATVSVEAGAGKNSGIPDAEFTAAGAHIASSAINARGCSGCFKGSTPDRRRNGVDA